MTEITEALLLQGRRSSNEMSPHDDSMLLRAFSEELAERVKSETLSRRSMQEMLKQRFPGVSEDTLTRSMQAALRLTLTEEEDS